MNAADALILTSLNEGSPNVIKEAMACNCPIVSTDVGDVRDIIGNTQGCFVTNFDYTEIADKIYEATNYGTTNGSNMIKNLTSKTIAGKIIDIYKNTINLKSK
jgi:glycosyltransferase involved in cell wall biosynthesis